MKTDRLLILAASALLLVGAGCAPAASTTSRSDDASVSVQADGGLQVDVTPVEAAAPPAAATPSASVPVPATSGQTAQAKTYTMADVAAHKDAASCWSAIDGGVYDLTGWIGRHPGGSDAIFYLCGKDGSDAFNEQHGGQRRPARELDGFKIGALK